MSRQFRAIEVAVHVLDQIQALTYDFVAVL
jgi:hypothetical protein